MEYLNISRNSGQKQSEEISQEQDRQDGGTTHRDQKAQSRSRSFSGFLGRLWRMLPGLGKEKKSKTGLGDRESSRLPLVIPVTLCGRDEGGQAFREATRTVNVSKRGARILTLHDLATDTHVWIENPGVGKTAIAKVIRKGKCLEPQEATEICVKVLELLRPESIWGIESPPGDWRKESDEPSAAERLEYLLAKERLTRHEILSYEAVETAVPEAEPEEKAHEPLALLEPGVSPRETTEVAETADSTPAEPENVLRGYASVLKIAPQPNTAIGDIPLTTKAEAARTPETAPQSSVSSALEESEDSRKISTETSRGEPAGPSEDSIRAAPQLVEAAVTSINSAAAEAMAAFQQKVVAHTEDLDKTARSLVERAARQLQEHQESGARDTEAAKISINLAGEQARAQLEAAKAEMESSYAARVEAHVTRMAEISSAVEAIEQRAGTLLKKVEEALEESLQAFQQKSAAGKAELDVAAQGLLLSTRKRIQAHAEATVAGLSEKARATLAMTAEEGRKQVANTQQALEDLARTAGERFDQRLAQKSKEQAEIAGRTSEAATNTINLTAERAVSRLEATEKKIEEGFSTWAEVFQSRLGELFAGMEGLERHSEALLRDFRCQLEQALQEFVERKTAETGNLEEAAHDGVERLAQQVKEQADATIEKMREEAQAVVRSAEEESQKRLANASQALEFATRAATELYTHRLDRTSTEQNEQAWLNADEVVNSISLAAEEAVTRVEAAQAKMEARFTALVEMHEKRAAEISSSLEEFERRSEAVLNDFRDQLQGASSAPHQEDAAEFPREKSAGAR